MKQISIQTLRPAELQEAAQMTARALAPTPFAMAISRGREGSELAMETMFKVMFGRWPGQVFVAKK